MKKRFKFLFDHMEEIVLVPGFAIMLIINFGNVLSRYLLPTSWAFTEELCVMMFVYVTFFGAAVAVKQRQHLGFTLILDKLPPVPRIVVDTLNTGAVVVFIGIMVYYGVLVCQNQLAYGSVTAALRISPAWGSACIPVSGVFIILRVLQAYGQDLRASLERMRGKEEV